jgi:hypothetical protein
MRITFLALILSIPALAQTVATPVATPGAGTYSTVQTVTLTDSTGGATICYTLDGTTPAAATPGTCSNGFTYSTAIVMPANITLQAIGTLSGQTNSAVLTAAYVVSSYPPSTCTTTATSTCPTNGNPTNWCYFGAGCSPDDEPSAPNEVTSGCSTTVFGIFGGQTQGTPCGETYEAAVAGFQAASSTIINRFSPYPSNSSIVISAHHSALDYTEFDSDPGHCPNAPTSACIYNLPSRINAMTTALTAPLGSGGMGLKRIDVQVDISPTFSTCAYHNVAGCVGAAPPSAHPNGFCPDYTSSTVPLGTACFDTPNSNWLAYTGTATPGVSGTNATEFANKLTTYSATWANLKPNANSILAIEPQPPSVTLSICGMTGSTGATEAVVEACLGPQMQAWQWLYPVDYFVPLHEAAGGFCLILCSHGNFIGPANAPVNAPAHVNVFMQHSCAAIKAASAGTVKCGEGFSSADFNTSPGNAYKCPNVLSSDANFLCDAVTNQPWLDFVQGDIYPSPTQTAASYANQFPAPASASVLAGDNSWTLFVCVAIGGSVNGSNCPTGYHTVAWGGGSYSSNFGPATSLGYSSGFQAGVGESSFYRWSVGGPNGSQECGTGLGGGWSGWYANGINAAWINAVPLAWARSMQLGYFVLFTAPQLFYASSDVNNTHVINNCTGWSNDQYMPTMMANIGVSPTGTLYGQMAASSSPRPGTLGLVSLIGKGTIH